MKGFQPGDLVTVAERATPVTVWADTFTDDVVEYIFPGEICVVLGIDQMSESLRVIDTKRWLEGWVSQNVVNKVK